MDRYTLIVTEKPDAAHRIAEALDVYGKAEKIVKNGVPFYRAYRNGDLVVVPALGHLYTVASKRKVEFDCPVFDYHWVPRYLAERNASRIRVWLEVIAKLAEKAEVFIDACDFDVEGSIIGYFILKYTCDNKEQIARRMKYSTLTKEELQESYAHLLPNLDFTQVEAGLTRHEVDWLYGINLSRALTSAVKSSSGQYATLSTGRVQGPTLKFIEKREKTIKCFVPTPYWIITAKMSISEFDFEAEYEQMLQTKTEAKEVLSACKMHEGKIETVESKEFEQNPPFPFDLGSLQSEAYKIFHYNPVFTSNIAQHLYLAALISYPRTSSQKLPAAIGYESILRKLSKMPAYSKQATELLFKSALKPNEGPKADPAHPAIYPTGNLPEKTLAISQENIFDLIVRRFMAVFGEPAIRQSVKVTIDINGRHFCLNRLRTISEGWFCFYKPYIQLTYSALPPVTEGQEVFVNKVVLKENFTKPPARYNPRSLLLKMEKENIGTKATRAATIQTLFDRKYLCGINNLSISELGFEVIETLSKYCPSIISSELTRKIEEEMDQIQLGKETKEEVLLSALAVLKPAITKLKEKRQVVGARLSQALNEARLEEKTVGACPKCGNGKLLILRSRKTGKRFVGCNNYFEGKCSLSLPLPQSGNIKALSSTCKNCGYPMISVSFKGKSAWKLCINPACPSKGVSKK